MKIRQKNFIFVKEKLRTQSDRKKAGGYRP